MKTQMRLNALDMNCVGGTPGLWLHPDDQTTRYNTLDYWMDLAKLLERGLFDSLFIADIFGVYDVYGGNADAGFRNAVEFPVNDPFLLVPAMATVTKHLVAGVSQCDRLLVCSYSFGGGFGDRRIRILLRWRQELRSGTYFSSQERV